VTAEQTTASSKGSTTVPTGSRKGNLWRWVFWALGVLTIAAVAWNARDYPDARVGNPEVTGIPRPVRPLLGFRHWLAVEQVGTLIVMLIVVAVCVWGWRRHGPHPYILMAIVTTFIVWQDPIMNWAPYAVYDPRLWHWPESWPLVSLSPTVEPFIVFGYVLFQFGPYFPAAWVLRKIQARRPVDAFVWRHPLISLGLLIFVVGFIVDMFLEVAAIRTGLYSYSQLMPFGSIFVGTPHQFPLLWESSLVTLVMIPAGILVYRDDTGRTVSEKLAQRARIFPTRPVLGSFMVMLVIVNVFYLFYGGAFALMKWSRATTSVACPWPFPDAKVYDPQGFYEENGQKGPYSSGIWSTYMMLQPDGRPTVTLGSKSDRCAEHNNG
jgi:Spirocyclase AveC-like